MQPEGVALSNSLIRYALSIVSIIYGSLTSTVVWFQLFLHSINGVFLLGCKWKCEAVCFSYWWNSEFSWQGELPL